MPVRWPVWMQAAVFVVALSMLLFLFGPAPDTPWTLRLAMAVCIAVLCGACLAVGTASGQRRAFGDRLTTAQRNQVEAIVRGRVTSEDPQLSRAAFSLAREWTSWHNSWIPPALLTGVCLVGTVGAAVDAQPEFWFWAVVVVAGSWGMWVAARNRAAAARFLATAGPPPASVAEVPQVN